MVDYAKSLSLGNGFDRNTTLGPIQNAVQYERVKDLAASIRNEGLDMATEDVEVPREGYFIPPMIVRNPPDTSRVVREEPFGTSPTLLCNPSSSFLGPIFPVMQWSDEADVLVRANDSVCGLGASVWTRDMDQAERLSRRLKAGNVWINTHMKLRPDAAFSGHGLSGIGAELGVEGIKSYCNAQTIYLKKA